MRREDVPSPTLAPGMATSYPAATSSATRLSQIERLPPALRMDLLGDLNASHDTRGQGSSKAVTAFPAIKDGSRLERSPFRSAYAYSNMYEDPSHTDESISNPPLPSYQQFQPCRLKRPHLLRRRWRSMLDTPACRARRVMSLSARSPTRHLIALKMQSLMLSAPHTKLAMFTRVCYCASPGAR
jgi:hypothetical protein